MPPLARALPEALYEARIALSGRFGDPPWSGAWEAFGIRLGPFGIDINSPGHAITQTQTETSHRLRIWIDPTVKETIKARLVSPGLLEIEWPRVQGEEIPVE